MEPQEIGDAQPSQNLVDYDKTFNERRQPQRSRVSIDRQSECHAGDSSDPGAPALHQGQGGQAMFGPGVSSTISEMAANARSEDPSTSFMKAALTGSKT